MTPSQNLRLHLRLAGILLLILLCLVLQGAWIKQLVNEKARSTQLTNAREHYSVVLADLDRRWGREAFDLKTRIEAQGFLENSRQQSEKLLAYLTSQGSSIEFPSLRIENKNREVVASYDYAGHINTEVKFMPGQTSTWIRSAGDNHLYLVIRQFIWLGKENGYLLLFRPMDHALLTRITYPGTRLSLWWKGSAVASSDGEDGLGKTANAFARPENSETSVALTCAGPESEISPRLLVETLGSDLIATSTVVTPLILVLSALLLGLIASFFMRRIKSSQPPDGD